MGNKFCKFKDTDNQSYVIVDKNRQPLACVKDKNKCYVGNYQKILDYPDQYNSVSESVVFEETNVPCVFENNGDVAALSSIDQNNYKFAIYDSANGPKSSDSTMDSEAVYYGLYAGVTQNNILNRDELRKRHDMAKLLFRESQIKATQPTPAPSTELPKPSMNLRTLSSNDDETNNDDIQNKKTLFIALAIGVALVFLLILAMAFS